MNKEHALMNAGDGPEKQMPEVTDTSVIVLNSLTSISPGHIVTQSEDVLISCRVQGNVSFQNPVSHRGSCKMHLRPSQMAQWVKKLATRLTAWVPSRDLHGGGENQLSQVVL